MKILITGGSGFLGSAVRAEAEKRGNVVTSFDLETGGDVRDAAALMEASRGHDAVIHLAGVLGTAELFDSPELAVDVNVKGTLNVLQACRKHQLRYVGIAMPECWPNVYQATKLCAKRLATAWHIAFGIPVSHVRAFNAFGPGQKYGPGHPQKIVPTFATLAWQGQPIPIWGDGTQLVDLIHSADIARMMINALAFGNDETFDAGTGRPMTVFEVASRIISITGSKSGVEYLPMRAGETPTRVTYARGEGWPLLDWRPTFDATEFANVVMGYR